MTNASPASDLLSLSPHREGEGAAQRRKGEGGERKDRKMIKFLLLLAVAAALVLFVRALLRNRGPRR